MCAYYLQNLDKRCYAKGSISALPWGSSKAHFCHSFLANTLSTSAAALPTAEKLLLEQAEPSDGLLGACAAAALPGPGLQSGAQPHGDREERLAGQQVLLRACTA